MKTFMNLYEIECVPVDKNGPHMEVKFRFVVAAVKSSEATRKVVQFFKDNSPEKNYTGIELLMFHIIVQPAQSVVLV